MSQKEALAAAQAALSQSINEFFDMYDKFVSNLAQVFSNPNNIDHPLERARLNIAIVTTAVDFDDRVKLLATRWDAMASNPKTAAAFESKNDAYFMANMEGPSMLSELGVAQILASDQFPANRPFFWAYIKKLSKKARAVVEQTQLANATPADPTIIERDAAMARTLEEMGLAVRHTTTGELNLNIKELMDPAKAKRIFAKVMKGQKGDTSVMNTALDTVKSMFSGGEEGEKALSTLLSQSH